MSKSVKAAVALGVLLSLTVARPVMADEATMAFQANIERSIETLNQMQALFARIDQRHKDQAAAAAAAANTTPAPEAAK